MLTPRDRQTIITKYGNGSKTVRWLSRNAGISIREVREVLTEAGFVLVGADAGKDEPKTFCKNASTGNRKDMIQPAEANRLMALWGRPHD
jgi:hypothetical protein